MARQARLHCLRKRIEWIRAQQNVLMVLQTVLVWDGAMEAYRNLKWNLSFEENAPL